MAKGMDFVFSAIDIVNAQADDGFTIKKAPETSLLGGSGDLDSLLFVNLVIAVEEAIHDETGELITLVTENTMNIENSPFKTVQSLSEYVDKRITMAIG
jgi:D-alanine--poly(phosphoribitol) ligase subunit 2